MALGEEMDVLNTRIDPATAVTGNNNPTCQDLALNNLPLVRQLLLCRVALGKSFFQFSAMKMAHAPPGHHSVVGR